ncbi:hypothetical protein D3C75_523140 [compost metagenome]
MHIATGPDEVAHGQIALLGHHVGQQGVARDVERQTEEDVAAALIELAGELAVRHIELEEGVTRGERHLVQLTHVPGGDYDAARIRVVLDVIHRLLDLVDDGAIGRRPGAPLGTIDRAQIAVLVSPLVPDADAVLFQVGSVGVAIEEPQQLVNDGTQVALLGGDQREAFRQIEAHLMTEQGDCPRAGAIGFDCAFIQDLLHQVEIGPHCFASFAALPNSCGRL